MPVFPSVLVNAATGFKDDLLDMPGTDVESVEAGEARYGMGCWLE